MLRTSAPREVFAGPPEGPLSTIAEALCDANEHLLPGRPGRRGRPLWPSRPAVAALADGLRAALFPGPFGPVDLAPGGVRAYLTAQLEKLQPALEEQIRRGLSIACEHADSAPAGCPACARRAAETAAALLGRLPAIRRVLETDLRAAFASDPAATFLEETLQATPGLRAITDHRLAHELHGLGVPLVPRLIAELARAATGIDIHPGAEIGPHFFIDHGAGVVIGETCRLGARVRLYQGVTLGARGFSDDPYGFLSARGPRRPVIGDDVVIHAGATVAGEVTVGAGAIVGGNVWLTHDVPPGARVTQGRLVHDTFEDGAGI
ncbi:MAG TPA: serine O-acetyltransferase [Polyangia bacterium]|nr:serine O-acetyltransferase [Polyangia bacterium]